MQEDRFVADASSPSSVAFSPSALKRWLAPRLLAWFDQHRRDLPWRRDRDPYRIWVSEVMLQQTQVVTVIPYFDRFLACFPTLTDLARADEAEVLRLWEGLGYYRRARDLLRAAQRILQEHAGQFPNDPDALAGLPGMGEYTRNAVLSQAFDLRLPILEANSQRVLSRLFARTEDPRTGPGRRWLWQAAAELLPNRRVGAFNQALMELGALVCTPTAPRCGDCPLALRCAARQQGRQEEIPPRPQRPATTFLRESGIIIHRADRLLLVQRPPSGRWASLWEFPHGPCLPDEPHPQAAQRLAEELTGLQITQVREMTTLQHSVTRYRITLVCYTANRLAGTFRAGAYVDAVWVPPSELPAYPVSAPQRRLALALARHAPPPDGVTQ